MIGEIKESIKKLPVNSVERHESVLDMIRLAERILQRQINDGRHAKEIVLPEREGNE